MRATFPGGAFGVRTSKTPKQDHRLFVSTHWSAACTPDTSRKSATTKAFELAAASLDRMHPIRSPPLRQHTWRTSSRSDNIVYPCSSSLRRSAHDRKNSYRRGCYHRQRDSL